MEPGHRSRHREADRRHRRHGAAAAARLLALCLFVPALPALGAEWTGVTVVTASGWEYAGVTVETTPGSPEVTIRQEDGARRRMSRANVRVILDANGQDITTAVFGDLPPPPAPPAPDRPAGTVHAPFPVPAAQRPVDRTNMVSGVRYRFALSAAPGFGAAGGDWYEGMNHGLAVNLGARLTVTDAVYFGFRYRYQKLGVDRSLYESFYFVDEYGYPVDAALDFDVHLDEFYGAVGFQTVPFDYSAPIGFFEAGLGAIAHHIETSVATAAGSDAFVYEETKIAVLFAGGGVFPIGRRAGIELQADMRITGSGDTNSYDAYDTSTTGFLFGAGLGLVWLIGS